MNDEKLWKMSWTVMTCHILYRGESHDHFFITETKHLSVVGFERTTRLIWFKCRSKHFCVVTICSWSKVCMKYGYHSLCYISDFQQSFVLHSFIASSSWQLKQCKSVIMCQHWSEDCRKSIMNSVVCIKYTKAINIWMILSSLRHISSPETCPAHPLL